MINAIKKLRHGQHKPSLELSGPLLEQQWM
jgi:hypothetical protein